MRKWFLIIPITAVFFMGFVLLVFAQQSGPQFMITWKSDNYVPPEYGGKSLPAVNSAVTASFELVDKGKLVDISNETVYWYVNNEFLKGGAGAQNASFVMPPFPGRPVDLRVELPDYGGGVLKTVEVPIGKPEVVIETPFPNNTIYDYSTLLLGKPYFFNIKNPLALNFSWSANGQSPVNSNDPETLTVNVDKNAQSGLPVNVILNVENPINDLIETANYAVGLIFVKK